MALYKIGMTSNELMVGDAGVTWWVQADSVFLALSAVADEIVEEESAGAGWLQISKISDQRVYKG